VSKVRRIFGVLGSLLMILALISSVISPIPVMAEPDYPLTPTDTEVSSALDYLHSQQSSDGSIGGFGTSAWVIMAIAAAGEDPHDWKVGSNPSIVDYLENNASSAGLVTDYARMILAITAANEEPTNFGGVDFVAQLKASCNNNQIGDSSILSDDFWGVMALISAGESPDSEVIANSVAFIKSNQNSDNGWSWGVGQGSDVDDTAAAIMALISAGEPQSSSVITNALAYIKSTQMDSGGFESWGATNAGTDSWAIDAIVAAGQDPTSSSWTTETGNTPVGDLLSFQQSDGSFYWQSDNPGMSVCGTTASAIEALLGKPYPVRIFEGIPIYVRVEGEDATIWTGDVAVAESDIIADNSGATYHLSQSTALGALDEASNHEARFSYYVTDEYGGLYVRSINGEEPTGVSGWMYRVDYCSPSVGADNFILNNTAPPEPPHEQVLFYYGGWTDLPLKISLNKTEVEVDEEFIVTVAQYNDETHDWLPCANAIIHADQNYEANDNGTATISIGYDATLSIFAEKEGYVRSDKVTVTVGEGTIQPLSSEGVSLTADIIPAISMEVNPDYIAFSSELGPGDISDEHAVTISNAGAWEIVVTAEVTDEDGLFVTGLRLDGELWTSSQIVISRGDSRVTQVSLRVPVGYTGLGEKTGTLTFWAEEAP